MLTYFDDLHILEKKNKNMKCVNMSYEILLRMIIRKFRLIISRKREINIIYIFHKQTFLEILLKV